MWAFIDRTFEGINCTQTTPTHHALVLYYLLSKDQRSDLKDLLPVLNIPLTTLKANNTMKLFKCYYDE